MNCNEFQIILMQEPASTETGFLQHVSDCDDCREQYEQAMEFEVRLQGAMDIDAPDELTGRVLHALDNDRRRATAVNRQHWALAAGFMLLFVVTGWLGFQWGGSAAYAKNLPQVVSRHIQKEQHHLHSQERVGEAALARLFTRFGAVMRTDVGEVTFAAACWIRHQHGIHLILREASGPVTLIYMPGEDVAHEQALQLEQSSGLLIPAAYGSLAIMAPSREIAEQVYRRVNNALMWGS